MDETCFFCNNSSDIAPFDIFKAIVYPLEKPANELIGELLELKIVSEEDVHSSSLCMSCFQLLIEFAKLEARAAEIRTTLFGSYNSTIQAINSVGVEEHIEEEEEEQEEAEEELNDIVDSSGGRVKQIVIKNAGSIRKSKMLTSDIEEVDLVDEDGLVIERIEDDGDDADDVPLDIYAPADLTGILENKNNVHTCKLCPGGPTNIPFSVETSHVSLMATHIRHQHDITLFLCDICGNGYHDKAGMEKHLEDHENESAEDLCCKHCDRTFETSKLFKIHMRIHSAGRKGLWICNVCNRTFASRNMLEEHMNAHLGVRPYKCDHCPKAFSSKYTLKSHTKTHQERSRVHPCSICGKGFMTTQTLAAHEKTHSASKSHPCQLCGKTFASQRSLEVHAIVHSGEKPFACQHCPKAFARKAEVVDHERTHTGERPFKCDMCEHAFSQRSNLLSHRRVTHYDDRRYQCTVCNKCFKRRRLLDYHVKAVHTHEKPFKCNVCDASFIYPEHYKKHLRIHSGLKPFKCEVCDKGFNSKDNRNAHRFVHSDKKPYECSTCRAGFMRKPLLFNHMEEANHMQDTIVVNSPRIGINGELIEESRLKTLEGWEEDENEEGQLIDFDGKVISLVRSLDDGETVMATINEHGQLVNEDGQIITDTTETFIVDDSNITMIDENSSMEEEVKYVHLHSNQNAEEIEEEAEVAAETLIGVKSEPTM